MPVPEPSTAAPTMGKLAKAAGVPLHRFPETPQEADVVEAVLAQALEQLTMDQHEKFILDVHGFIPMEEDPVLIEQHLREMDYELILILPKEKEAYLLAQSMNPPYVNNRSIRLLFLRFQSYKAKLAAQAMVKHFEAKRQLFGDGDVLARPVRQSDLSSAEDQQALHSGFFQIHPSRDAAGRAIFINIETVPNVKKHLMKTLSGQRALWYMSMKALEDEATQINGVVWVSMLNWDGFNISTDDLHGLKQLDTVLPYRSLGGHICYSDARLRTYVVGMQLFSPEEDRYRVRVHFGSREHIAFRLQTFGIPAECYKAHNDGTYDCQGHLAWLAVLKDKENQESSPSSSRVLIPNCRDVLFGKSTMARQHPGTLRALDLVDRHYSTYEQLEKSRKSYVVELILGDIHSTGGRFLRQGDGIWEIVSDEDARKKISHWFRHTRFKRRSSTDSNPGESTVVSTVPTAFLSRTNKRRSSDSESMEAQSRNADSNHKKASAR